jgi:hypothetical protein
MIKKKQRLKLIFNKESIAMQIPGTYMQNDARRHRPHFLTTEDVPVHNE